MKIKWKHTFSVILLLAGWQAYSQTPTDAFLMEKGQVCVAVLYSHDTWNQYWEGTLKRENGNIGTLTRQTVMPMVAVGLFNRLNLIAALPWVRTQASAGQVKGAQGLQDWGFWVKGEVLNARLGLGDFTWHATAGMIGPASNYLPDYAPFSLGLGCIDGTFRTIFQYRLDKGLFLRGQAGYHLRGPSIIERDYYYTTFGVYSDEVDMPNAITFGGVLGTNLLQNSLRLEATFDGLNTLGGFDIRRQDMGFPANRMNMTRAGLGIQYYPAFARGLSIIASGSRVITGRNVGQSLILTGGLAYQFNLWNK